MATCGDTLLCGLFPFPENPAQISSKEYCLPKAEISFSQKVGGPILNQKLAFQIHNALFRLHHSTLSIQKKALAS
jgi:hypothetical protein